MLQNGAVSFNVPFTVPVSPVPYTVPQIRVKKVAVKGNLFVLFLFLQFLNKQRPKKTAFPVPVSPGRNRSQVVKE